MPFDPFFIVLILFAVAVLWWMPRNARKQQAAAMAFRDSLQPGQEVITIGRMYGTVVAVDENRVTLELSDGVVGVWDKEGIMRLVPPADDADLDGAADDELADEEYEDEYDEEYDEELAEDELAEDELAADDASIDDQIDEALVTDERDAALAAETDDEWSEVEVPDDASSLTDPDEDEKKPR